MTDWETATAALARYDELAETGGPDHDRQAHVALEALRAAVLGTGGTAEPVEMTWTMREALAWLGLAGSLRRGKSNDFANGVVAGRTAGALERLGYAQRHDVDGRESYLYITEEGRKVAPSLESLQ